MEEIVIVCSSDNNFTLPLTVVLYSALVNLNKEAFANIFILDAGINEKNKKKIAFSLAKASKNFKIEYIVYSLDNFSRLKETSAISRATYLRILIPTLIPSNYSKAIYLDCDMIVEDDLFKIWEIPFNDKELAAGVQDYYFPFLKSSTINPLSIENMQDNVPYCNAGLMVFNLEKFREENIAEKIISYIKTYQPILNDQDGINAVLNGRWILLEPRWNITLSSISKFLLDSKQNINSLKDNVGIIHYTSKFKPWHIPKTKDDLVYLYYHKWAFNIYDHYLKQTCFIGKFPYLVFKFQRDLLLFKYKLMRKFGLVQ